jgi:hypothetical protein
MFIADSIQTSLTTAVTLRVMGGGVPAYIVPALEGGTVSV